MSADNLLMLLIVGAYFGLLLIGCWLIGQLLLMIVDFLADWFERRCKSDAHHRAEKRRVYRA